MIYETTRLNSLRNIETTGDVHMNKQNSN